MNRYRGLWSRSLTGALALLVGLSFAAPPASADDAVAAAPGKTRPSLAEAAKTTLAKLDTSPAVVTTQQPSGGSSDSKKPFFKTTKGVVILTVMAAGVVYTLYSKDKDRVRSPIR